MSQSNSSRLLAGAADSSSDRAIYWTSELATSGAKGESDWGVKSERKVGRARGRIWSREREYSFDSGMKVEGREVEKVLRRESRRVRRTTAWGPPRGREPWGKEERVAVVSECVAGGVEVGEVGGEEGSSSSSSEEDDEERKPFSPNSPSSRLIRAFLLGRGVELSFSRRSRVSFFHSSGNSFILLLLPSAKTARIILRSLSLPEMNLANKLSLRRS